LTRTSIEQLGEEGEYVLAEALVGDEALDAVPKRDRLVAFGLFGGLVDDVFAVFVEGAVLDPVADLQDVE
jgi:hypothetical protein